MSQKIVILIVGIFIGMLILVIIQTLFSIKGKTSEPNIVSNIIMYVAVPTIIGLLTAYLGNLWFAPENNDRNAHITARDEQIIKEHGCKSIEQYYVRVAESDTKLDTKRYSPNFQRIETTDQVKSKNYKYRYIEVINKYYGTAPTAIKYYKEPLEKKRMVMSTIN